GGGDAGVGALGRIKCIRLSRRSYGTGRGSVDQAIDRRTRAEVGSPGEAEALRREKFDHVRRPDRPVVARPRPDVADRGELRRDLVGVRAEVVTRDLVVRVTIAAGQA